jgi:leucyl/phenylalanyl-tRNA---protein transferase
MSGPLKNLPNALDPDMLLKAYSIGIFPMADSRDDPEIYWVEPKKRAILPLDGFLLSHSLAKTIRQDRFETTADRAFDAVVAACAEATKDRPSTWINAQIEQAVHTLHQRGQAHSIETWHEGQLVGGLYGISLGRAFFGESMFSRATDASKVALAHLVARLKVGGFILLDCQFQTDHLASLGAIEISNTRYSSLLSAAVSTVGASGATTSDFGALDREDGPSEPSSPRAMMVSSPISGWRISQALTQTS